MDVFHSLSTAVYSSEFPQLFARFQSIVGAGRWLDRTRKIADEIRGNRLLERYLREENRVAFALSKLSEETNRYGGFRSPLVDSKDVYQACVLVSQFLDVYDRHDLAARKAVLGRLRGALANPDDLRALQFEWLAAVHLVKRGFEVAFPRTTQYATMDLLAKKNGVLTEVECKSITRDKGRQIHRRPVLDLQSSVLKRTFGFAKQLKKGLAVRAILHQELPSSHVRRQRLAGLIASSILNGASIAPEELKIHLVDFEVAESPFTCSAPQAESVHKYVQEYFAIDNKDLSITFSPGKRALLLSIESAAADNLLAYAFEAIKDACDRQLSGTNPGIVFVKFEDISASELEEIAAQQNPPTPLRVATSNFIDTRRKSHLVALSFFCDGELGLPEFGATSQQGSSYFFENTESPFFNLETVSALRTSV